MIHGLKVSLAKGTTKKKIIKQDESLSATKNTLYQWRTSVQSLLSCIVSNEEAWNSIFSTFSSFESIGSSIYPENDVPVLTLLKDLQTAKSRLDTPESNTVEPNFNAVQRLDLSKKELNSLISRIDNTESMHEKRLEIIRQHKYYDSKTRQMIQSEAKRRNPISQKDIERRSRNQTKVQDLAQELASINRNIYAEMDAIEVERLAVTDRALSAMLLLQRHYFEANPLRMIVSKADEIGLGHRVLLRSDHRPWISSENKGQSNDANSQIPPANVAYPPYGPSGESAPFPRVDTAPTAPPPDDVSSGYGASYSPMPQSPPPPPPPPSSNGYAPPPHTSAPPSYAIPSTSPRTSDTSRPPPPPDYAPRPSASPVSAPQATPGYDPYMSHVTPGSGALDSNMYRSQPPNPPSSNPMNYVYNPSQSLSSPLNSPDYHSSQGRSATSYQHSSLPQTSSAATYSSPPPPPPPPRPPSSSYPMPPSVQSGTGYQSSTVPTPPPPPAPPSAYETPAEGPGTSQNRLLRKNSKSS